MNGAKVIKVAKIIVRDIPALLITVSRAEEEMGIRYEPLLEEYREQTVRNKRILLVRGKTAQEAFRVTYVLGLYTDIGVVAFYDHDRHAFQVTIASSTKEFTGDSEIHRDDIHALQPAHKSA
jgi:hypothetical protein